jgi:beta-glucosidase
MRIKQGIIILLITAIGVSLSSGQPVPNPATGQAKPAAKTSAASTADEKARRLLAKMTLDEKIGQMVQYSKWGNKQLTEAVQKELAGKGMVGSFLNVVGSAQTNDYQRYAVENSRLHIPLLFGLDVIHGFKTIFPIPLAEDCCWDPDLLEKCAAVAGREAYAAGVRWTFAPMVDVSREPRWGRISEGSGEDPFLGSIMAAARVRGFQGRFLSDAGSIAACAKHYVGYGAAEAGREYNTTDMSEITLREVYLPPFRAAVDAGVATIMSAFNDLSGVPASGNRHTIREILKGEWGFSGFVVSDWASVEELKSHGYAVDDQEAAQKGALAGVDMDMQSGVYSSYLAKLVKEKKLSMNLIDDAVLRILKVKYELGLFKNPYTDETKESESMVTPANLDMALQEARESIVLLKNEKNILPFSKNIKTIAVIGVLANSKKDCLGPWHCRGEEAMEKIVTILDAIKARLPLSTRVLYAEGVSPSADDAPRSLIDEAVNTAKQADVAIVVAGELQNMSGEAASRVSISIPGLQEEMIKAIQKTGVPVVLVLMNGRPLAIPWEADNVPAILESWFLGDEQGNAVADVLFGDFNPCGRLVVTFPRSVGQVPIYYSQKNTGRPIEPNNKFSSKYIDSPNTPQFPFGFGLEYTGFSYENLEINPVTPTTKDGLKVTAEITNTGAVSGTEVVQVYIQDIAADITQPVRKLVDFLRLELVPGEKKTVEFRLPASRFGYYNEKGRFVIKPGRFNIWVAKNASDASLSGSFNLVKAAK